MTKTAVVTGASSGIGAATARRLAAEGFFVVMGARRFERVQELADEIEGRALRVDVTDARSVKDFAAAVEAADVLVNNAGLASGLEDIADMSEYRLRIMWETNVAGLVRVTQAFLPKLEASGAGHIVNVGSIAGFETYQGGGGYAASKHAVRAVTLTLRQELVGKPIRITHISPGHVASEFALVRFDGDEASAGRVYEGFTPLAPDDVADAIAWSVTRPPNVNIDEVVLRARAQATATLIARADD